MVNDDYDDNDDDCDYHDNDDDNDDERPELVEPTPVAVPCTHPLSRFRFDNFMVHLLLLYFYI